MNRLKSTITIHDVAKATGVSISTVSRVLNDKGDVSPATYEKVRRVIEELGYTSSLVAKSMRSRKTNVIGLVLPNVRSAFHIQVLRGVDQTLEQFGYDLIIYTGKSKGREAKAAWEQRQISRLNGSLVDGIIITTPTASTFSTAFPLVAVDPHNGSTDFPSVIATNRTGAMTAVEYLANLGHRRIGFIGGRPDLQSALRRLQGYKDGLLQAGIPLDPDLIQVGDFSRKTGFLCAQQLLSLPDRPTAIFAANDESALGVIDAARHAGLAVPQDLSVIGFDNIPEVNAMAPSLTTVDQSIETMGCIATQMLIDLIRGQTLSDNLYKVPTHLIVRDSCQAV
jgi:LacI family transcriptional regulator